MSTISVYFLVNAMAAVGPDHTVPRGGSVLLNQTSNIPNGDSFVAAWVRGGVKKRGSFGWCPPQSGLSATYAEYPKKRPRESAPIEAWEVLYACI